MKSRKTKPPIIQVNGQFMESGANDDTLHRTYQYHVHIENKDGNTFTDYDQTLTIKPPPLKHITTNSPEAPINNDSDGTLVEADDNLINIPHKPTPLTIKIATEEYAKEKQYTDIIKNNLLNKINFHTPLKQAKDKTQKTLQSCLQSVKKHLNKTLHKATLKATGKIITASLGILLIIYFVYIFYKPGEPAPYKAPITSTSTQDTVTLNEKQQIIAIPLRTPEQGTLEQFPIEEVTEPYTVVQQNEVIHTVVLGDTLWFIAKRYVHNPLRYPELARLSNIKNPDLIYPGDQIRIFVKK